MTNLEIEAKLKAPLLRTFLALMVVLMALVGIRDAWGSEWFGLMIDALVMSWSALAFVFFRRIGYSRVAVATAYGFTLLEIAFLTSLGYHNEDNFFLVVDVLILLLLFTTVFVQDLKFLAGVLALETLFLAFHITRTLAMGEVTTQAVSLNQQLFGPLVTFVLVAVMAFILRLYSNMANREYRAIATDREQRQHSQGQLIRGLSHHLNTPLGNSKMALSLQAENGAACLDPEVQRLVTTAVDASISVVGRLGEFMKQTEHAQITVMGSGSLADFFAHQQTLPVEVVESSSIRDFAARSCPHYWEPMNFVLNELIDNARVHGGADASVPRVSLDLTSGGEIEICVESSGPVIRPEVLARAREPFFSTLVSADHPGLGLYFADYIAVYLLAGTLSLRSEMGGGTTVTLRFPAQPVAQ